MEQCVHELDEGTCSICLGLELRFPKPPSVEMRANLLFDYSTSHSTWTKEIALRDLGWSDHQLQTAIQELRRILSGDDINLVCSPRGDTWWYELVSDVNKALPWATIRLRTVEGQLATLSNVTSSLVNATKANSKDGKKARLIQAQMTILQMQLSNLNEV